MVYIYKPASCKTTTELKERKGETDYVFDERHQRRSGGKQKHQEMEHSPTPEYYRHVRQITQNKNNSHVIYYPHC